jgi:hypothetical protein
MNDRERKRESARKKSEFSVYSQKAVRTTELRWTKENLCAAKLSTDKNKSDHPKKCP